MAKRKSSKKSLSTANIFRFLTAVLAIVAFCLMFGNQIKVTGKAVILGEGTIEYSFSDTFFSDGGNPLGFFGYLLILVGGLAACLLAFLKLKKTPRVVCNLLVIALLIAGTVLVFLTAVPFQGNNFKLGNLASSTVGLTVFPIIAGILGALSAGCATAGFLME